MWSNKYKNRVNWRDIELWKLLGIDYEVVKVEFCCLFVCDVR